MNRFSIKNAPNKQLARELSARVGARYKNILSLSTAEFLDLKTFEKNKSITQQTKITIVERDKKTYEEIKKKIPYKISSVIKTELTDYFPPQRFDFLNLDLMCSLGPGFLQWLNKVNLINGCDISINITPPRCNKKFYSFIDKTFHHSDFKKKLLNTHLNFSRLRNSDQQNIACAIASALDNYNFEIEPIYTYSDSNNNNPMTLFRFWNVIKKDYQNLDSWLKNYSPDE